MRHRLSLRALKQTSRKDRMCITSLTWVTIARSSTEGRENRFASRGWSNECRCFKTKLSSSLPNFNASRKLKSNSKTKSDIRMLHTQTDRHKMTTSLRSLREVTAAMNTIIYCRNLSVFISSIRSWMRSKRWSVEFDYPSSKLNKM